MAEPSEATTSSSSPSKLMDRKPVVVRVKRKANQERLDAFWLEINERPVKRPFLDLEGLKTKDSSEQAIEETRIKKILVQHVETISSSEAVKDALQAYLPNFNDQRDYSKKVEERRSILKQDKKQEQLRSVARQKHEDLARSARFEQIWKSRKERVEAGDDTLHEICHLYDIVRVDTKEPKWRSKHVSVEDNAILFNYLPLLREFIPSAVEEIVSDMRSYSAKAVKPAEDGTKEGSSAATGYVYDLYTVEDNMIEAEGEVTDYYPRVQVDEEECCDEFPEEDYATDDSNAEDNPRNEYPDEESSSGDEKNENEDPFDYFEDGDNSQDEDEVIDADGEDVEDWKWRHR